MSGQRVVNTLQQIFEYVKNVMFIAVYVLSMCNIASETEDMNVNIYD